MLDLANHHADATPADVEALCKAVKQYGFNSAFVNPVYVQLAKQILTAKLGVERVGTVISFPLGQDTMAIKVQAAQDAAKREADELDVCMNVGKFKAGDHSRVLIEMQAVVQAAREINGNIIVKFIIGTGYLDEEETKKASELVVQSGADFVKTNSGMGPRGARVEDVRLIRSVVRDKIKIKAAGGIHTLEQAQAFIEAGADRMGTSKAVEIIKELKG